MKVFVFFFCCKSNVSSCFFICRGAELICCRHIYAGVAVHVVVIIIGSWFILNMAVG